MTRRQSRNIGVSREYGAGVAALGAGHGRCRQDTKSPAEVNDLLENVQKVCESKAPKTKTEVIQKQALIINCHKPAERPASVKRPSGAEGIASA